MEKRRLTGFLSGTAASGPDVVEVSAAIDVEVAEGVTRLRVTPATRPESGAVRESRDPAVARLLAAMQHDLALQAQAEARRNAPCTPIWKPKRSQRPGRETVVCPDCEGVGDLAGTSCVACDGRGWRLV